MSTKGLALMLENSVHTLGLKKPVRVATRWSETENALSKVMRLSAR